MRRLIILILFFSTLICHGQFSKFSLTINNSSEEDSACYQLHIFTASDTVFSKFVFTDYENTFDSLRPGSYKIHLYSCSELKEIALAKSFTLESDKITDVVLDLSWIETHRNIDKKTRGAIVKSRNEVALNLSYFQNNWTNEQSAMKFNAGFGFTVYKWFTFSKHVGILTGAGLGLSHYSISNDTTFININQTKKTYEYYNYLDGHGDIKFRFTLGDQRVEKFLSPKALLDIGLIYNAPLVFKHVARYDGNKKITNNGLHQFTDFRAYVNFGFTPFLIFFEYRLTDFIISNYPEVPKYNMGIRLVFF